MVEELEDNNLELCYELIEAQPPMLRPHVKVLDDMELKSIKDEPPKLELKQLSSHLRYLFLGKRDSYPIIVNASLSRIEEEKLLKVLKDHKKAIRWQISDLRGISPTFCMHKIFMEMTTCL